MKKEDLIQKAKELVSAPNCCAEAKDAGNKYLESIGKDNEKSAAQNLISALEKNVNTIDETLAFASSEKAKEILGEETAKAMTERGRKVKAEGGKYCFCPACSAGSVILENKNLLLG